MSVVDDVVQALDPEEAVGLLVELVRKPSMTLDPPYERHVNDHLARYWSRLGLDVEVQDVANGRCNVLGTLRGQGGGPSLMLESHLDHGPVGSGWSRDPYGGEIDRVGGWIYGRGTCNNKQSLA